MIRGGPGWEVSRIHLTMTFEAEANVVFRQKDPNRLSRFGQGDNHGEGRWIRALEGFEADPRQLPGQAIEAPRVTLEGLPHRPERSSQIRAEGHVYRDRPIPAIIRIQRVPIKTEPTQLEHIRPGLMSDRGIRGRRVIDRTDAKDPFPATQVSDPNVISIIIAPARMA